ncbi:MAG: hypothetical protein FWF97_00415 [Alphaproteobacteria bacterium]|nr:hypothetical protein [Alphaproteobacteria bacterium]
MNEISPQDKALIANALLRLVGEEALTGLEKRDILHEITRMLTGFNIADIASETSNRRRLLLKRINSGDIYAGLAGEIAMDMEAKTLRIFDGETEEGILLGAGGSTPVGTYVTETDIDNLLAGMDYVVQTHRANDGSVWYRKYKSGWIEQGGILARGSNLSAGAHWVGNINLPVPMTDNNYSAQILSACSGLTTSGSELQMLAEYTTASIICFDMYNRASANAITMPALVWEVKGIAAQS